MSSKDLLPLIVEITWRFSARGLNGQCCGRLSMSEYRTLCLATYQSRCVMTDIAGHLGISKSGATRVVDRLEQSRFVKRMRSPDDGRVCCVEITSAGKEMIEALVVENESRMEKILSHVDPAMQQVVRVALESLVRAIKQEMGMEKVDNIN